MAEGAEKLLVPGSDRAPDCNIFRSSRIQLNNEEASVEMNNCLNILGYGHALRQKRQEFYKQDDASILPSGFVPSLKTIIVGSKAEGLSSFFESDRDHIAVTNIVECIEAGFEINSISENTPVFRMNTLICYPGHCILLLERGLPISLWIALSENALGQVLLSSTAYVNMHKLGVHLSQGPVLNERAGPSLPIEIGHLKNDIVFALRCHCPSILQRWAARSRHWPPADIVAKVVSMGAFLAPVGLKGSQNKHNEWRMCFNTGETELIINLNDTQVKLYVLLKMIAKDVLQPRNKEITSFMLKNIVLWLAENNPQSMFHERILFFWLRESLLVIKSALSIKKHCHTI
ncbi:hypothetical protein DPMN_028100 [Dreissena polymorpha]|uniref:Mab-21-like nucleotidyltransferase domain-containing protein n=1 Tax=Dreissena polymorpha TaxID=45954 RepID=A0A9D4LWL1_DREPO|nr:hypothetical protein DPMN_028100 [Dreissena polymorpha]